VGKRRAFPSMCYRDEEGVQQWSNEMIGREMFVNKITLEDLIKYHKIEFTVTKGYYYDEGRNYNIQGVIRELFETRKIFKMKGDPAQEIQKLIMNAGYGKSIMKEIETNTVFFNDKESFQRYMSKNYNFVDRFGEYGNGKYKVYKNKPISEHFNLAHVGSEILAMSKRIMNQVMYTAEDIGISIYYTDTDSMHIPDKDIPRLQKEFKKRYDTELIGKDMGQFHTDFSLTVPVEEENRLGKLKIKNKNCKNLISVESYFLGKKVYIDKLCGEHPVTGETMYGYHVRMKGVNSNSVIIYAKENEMDIMDVYKKLYEGDAITFDLIKGGCLNFKYDSAYNIVTDPIFTRKIQLSGVKIDIDENGCVTQPNESKNAKKVKRVRKRR
jgi:hypothetical protein